MNLHKNVHKAIFLKQFFWQNNYICLQQGAFHLHQQHSKARNVTRITNVQFEGYCELELNFLLTFMRFEFDNHLRWHTPRPQRVPIYLYVCVLVCIMCVCWFASITIQNFIHTVVGYKCIFRENINAITSICKR